MKKIFSLLIFFFPLFALAQNKVRVAVPGGNSSVTIAQVDSTARKAVGDTMLRINIDHPFLQNFEAHSPLKGNATKDTTKFVLDSTGAVTAIQIIGSTLQAKILGVWVTMGTIASGSATPGGTDHAVQFNQAGSFGGDNTFLYADYTNKLFGIGITPVVGDGSFQINGNSKFYNRTNFQLPNSGSNIVGGINIGTGGFTGGTNHFVGTSPINTDVAFNQPIGYGGNFMEAEIGGVSKFFLTNAGNMTLAGNLTAANFSGSHSGTSSGNNTGDQTITLSGDASGTGNGAITVTAPTANTTTRGMLTAADWNTFNGKAPLASPTFTGTPNIASATANSINNVIFTNPGTTATLTLANNSSHITVGAFSSTFTFSAATSVIFPTTGTLATLANTETFTNKTLTSPILTPGSTTIQPLKFQSGALLTTPVAGVEEFLTDKRYTTITTGTARKEYALFDIAGTSGRIPFETTNGRLTDNANFLFAITNGGILSVGTTSATGGNLNIGSTAAASGNNPLATFTGAAHTGQTASTELTDINFNLARNVTFATGALATQRAFRIQAPTYSFAATSTITKAVTFSISGPPAAGSLSVITQALAMELENGSLQVTNGVTKSMLFGNTATSQSSAATFTLSLMGGNVVNVSMVANITSMTINSNSYATGEYFIYFTQDATGSRTITGWPAGVKWPGGVAPTLTTTPNKTDIIRFIFDGSQFWASVVAQNY